MFVKGPAPFGADGLTARANQRFVALNGQNKLGQVSPGRALRIVAEGEPLSLPSEVVFDPTDSRQAFLCNFSPGNPDAAGVRRTRL